MLLDDYLEKTKVDKISKEEDAERMKIKTNGNKDCYTLKTILYPL